MNTGIIKPEVRILLVCRDEFNRMINYGVLCDKEEWAVSTATDPELAYHLFKKYQEIGQTFDLVFLDYLYAHTNGLTLARELKKLHPAVEIVFYPCLLFQDAGIKQDYINFFGYDKRTADSYDLVKIIIKQVIRWKQRLVVTEKQTAESKVSCKTETLQKNGYLNWLQGTLGKQPLRLKTGCLL